MYEIDATAPAAVAMTGYRGDVMAWGAKNGISVEDEKWVEWNMIPGVMGKPGIVYAHHWGGRVVYFSRRNLPGFDDEVKNFNPPDKLVGKRQPYFNSCYRSDSEDVVIVEGPADAESFTIWEISGVALCGVSIQDEGIASLKSRLKRHKRKYLLLDADKAGRSSHERVAQAIDPLVRLGDWSNLEADAVDEDGDEKSNKENIDE
jgi:DNA primase